MTYLLFVNFLGLVLILMTFNRSSKIPKSWRISRILGILLFWISSFIYDIVFQYYFLMASHLVLFILMVCWASKELLEFRKAG